MSRNRASPLTLWLSLLGALLLADPATATDADYERAYGLGWFQHDYQGRMVQFHTGSIDGMVAIAAVIPEDRFGVYVLALALADDRREQHERRALGQPQNLVDHLAHGLRGEVDAVLGAARLLDGGRQPVSSTDRAIQGDTIHTPEGPKPFTVHEETIKVKGGW